MAPANNRDGRDDDPGEDLPQRRKARARDEGSTNESGGARAGKPKSGSPVLLIALLGGGAVALLGCLGCGVGSYFLFFTGRPGVAGPGPGLGPIPGLKIADAPNLVGNWETKMGDTWNWEFRNDGTAQVVAKGPTITNQQGQPIETTTSFNYKLTPGDPAILEISDSRTEGGKGSLTLRTAPGEPKRFEVRSSNGAVLLKCLDIVSNLRLTRK